MKEMNYEDKFEFPEDLLGVKKEVQHYSNFKLIVLIGNIILWIGIIIYYVIAL